MAKFSDQDHFIHRPLGLAMFRGGKRQLYSHKGPKTSFVFFKYFFHIYLRVVGWLYGLGLGESTSLYDDIHSLTVWFSTRAG